MRLVQGLHFETSPATWKLAHGQKSLGGLTVEPLLVQWLGSEAWDSAFSGPTSRCWTRNQVLDTKGLALVLWQMLNLKLATNSLCCRDQRTAGPGARSCIHSSHKYECLLCTRHYWSAGDTAGNKAKSLLSQNSYFRVAKSLQGVLFWLCPFPLQLILRKEKKYEEPEKNRTT
jgi:hypothetical protein